jgi:hypothetical protein
VAAQVHLEEAVLSGDKTLGPEEILGRVGVDLRDAPVVPQHRDIGVQTGDRNLP